MKRNKTTNRVKRSGMSPWRRYNKGKGGEAGAAKRILTPQCMWVDNYIGGEQPAEVLTQEAAE